MDIYEWNDEAAVLLDAASGYGSLPDDLIKRMQRLVDMPRPAQPQEPRRWMPVEDGQAAVYDDMHGTRNELAVSGDMIGMRVARPLVSAWVRMPPDLRLCRRTPAPTAAE